MKSGAVAVAGNSGRLMSAAGNDCTAFVDTETAENATKGSEGSDRGGLCVNCIVGSTVVLALPLAGGEYLVPSAASLAASIEGLEADEVMTGRAAAAVGFLVVGVTEEDNKGLVVVTVAGLLLGKTVALLGVEAGNVRNVAGLAGSGLVWA